MKEIVRLMEMRVTAAAVTTLRHLRDVKLSFVMLRIKLVVTAVLLVMSHLRVVGIRLNNHLHIDILFQGFHAVYAR